MPSLSDTCIPTKRRTPGLYLSLLAFTIAGIIIIIALALNNPGLFGDSWLGNDTPMVRGLAISLLVLTFVPVIIGRSSDGHDWFASIYVISGAYALNFALRAFFVLNQPTFLIGQLIYWDKFFLALVYMNIGFCCLLAGYYLPMAAKIAGALPAVPFRWSTEPNLGKLFLLYLAGLVIRSIASLQIIPDAFSYYFMALSNFTAYVLAIITIYSFASAKNRFRFRILLLLILPLQVIYAMVWSVGKYSLILPIIIFLMCYHYIEHHMSLCLALIAGLIIALVIFPFIATYRTHPEEADYRIRIDRTIDDITRMDLQSYADLALTSMVGRAHLLDSFAVVIKYIQPDMAVGIKEYLLIPAYAYLPRVFWPDKPAGSGVGFSRDFFGSSGNSAGMSNPADLYQSLGVPGIIGGMFLLGMLYRLTYEFFIVRQLHSGWEARLPHLFFYVFILFRLYLGFEIRVTEALSEILKSLLFLSVIAWYMQPSMRAKR